jgi:YD repeat-containing protein
MNCQGCGEEIGERAALSQAVNQAVDEVLEASIQDAVRTGGVCPLCGHSKYVPVWQRRSVRVALLAICVLLLALILGVTLYYQSPLRSSLAHEAVQRAKANAQVKGALGEPIREGRLAGGTIHSDETGWSEAKLSIPLQGSRRKGTLKVIAGKGTGAWIMTTLEVFVEGEQKPIDLVRGRIDLDPGPEYQSVHVEHAVTPEMLDLPAPAPTSDGVYPVVEIQPGLTASGRYQVHAALTSFKPTVKHDVPINVFQVDLRRGAFVLRQTDLFVHDTIPLVLTRTYRQWDQLAHAFGLGGNHPYDIAPQGTRNPYTFMQVVLEDSDPVRFDRISKGTGYADAVYEHRDTESEFFKARIWWNGNGWTLRFLDGSEIQFPESYNAKNLAQRAPFEIRDAGGRSIRLQRDPERNLRMLVSPSGHFIRFAYDSQRRITEASDDRGRRVAYGYDSAGHLISVTDENGRQTRFAYDESDLIQTVEAGGHVLVRNHFANGGWVVQQDLADGSIWRYQYGFNGDEQVQTIVIAPEGTRTQFTFAHEIVKKAQTLK